uniref:ubiquitinyl hydrolase 1 n=1 Tax=Moniliophthora roreri TaxID=221103 RepID=A0A0W0G780_MONRR
MAHNADRLRYAINHVFLPPKLPQEFDQTGEKDHVISKIVFDSLKVFRGHLPTEETLKWTSTGNMIENYRNLQKSDVINTSDKLLHFLCAPAGIILRRSREHITSETFEVSPPSSEVINTTGRLICSYPGPAVQFSTTAWDSDYFKLEFASVFAQLNNEHFDEDAERDRRTSLDVEGSDTIDPKYITSMLGGTLRGLGGKAADVTRISKRIGDEALGKGKQTPWRRSGAWLVLRVAMQTTLMRQDPTHTMYKSFMAFLHAYILELALKAELDSDLLHIMRVKTSRRLAKLSENHAVRSFVQDYIQSICARMKSVLEKRWISIQSLDVTPRSVISDGWAPMALQVDLDTIMRLNNSTMYITTALSPDAPQPTDLPAFTPSEQPRLRDDDFGKATAHKLQVGFARDPLTTLADFEALVARGSLETWLALRLGNVSVDVDDGSAKHLWDLIRIYYSCANKYYAANPEEHSLMVLTILELWVAIDKLACAAHPLMENYSPEVPLDRSVDYPKALLRHLLLRKAFDLERLKRVDSYIRVRHKNATDGSVFSDKMSSRSFPIQYYNTCPEMQELRTEIEVDAQRARDSVVRELREKMAERRKLLDRMAATDHRHNEDEAEWGFTGRGRKRQKTLLRYPECPKCKLEVKLSALRARKHEWPLPEEEAEIKRVVFELQVPKTFALWRAATALLLFDLGTPPKEKQEFEGSKPSVLLSSGHADLSEYCDPADDDTSVITLASSSGSKLQFGNTTSLPVTEEEICVSSGMTWRGYDPRNRVWIVPQTGGNIFKEADTKTYGTLSLRSNPPTMYTKAGLSYAISGTRHPPNRVLADQSDCPSEMSLHEYIAYGLLCSGGGLQWMNLLRELRSTGSGLSWGNEEVGTLISMAIWQVGPFEVVKTQQGTATGELEWHLDLKELEFGLAPLYEARSLLERVEGNWKEVVTVRTIILIVSRLLSSSPHAEVTTECIELLRKARMVTWAWLDQLEEKLQDASEESVKPFQDKVCEMAAVCRSTFDVDDVDEDGTGDGYLPNLLSIAEDICIFACCGILVHDNTPTDLESTKSGVSPDFKRLLRRDQRLAHTVELRLRSLICTRGASNPGRQGLDEAITHIWAAYRPGEQGWTSMKDSNDRWVRCLTAAAGGAGPVQLVNLDLLRGRLLVNGKPLSRLPPEIVKHEVYMRIFGDKKVLDVIPANFRGMEFATRTLVSGYQVFFGMRDEKELVIRARKDHKVLELIPHEYFRGDLPVRLVNDYTHWLDLDSGNIELRPLSGIWESSDCNWIIHFLQVPRVCTNPTRMMIDINSPTFQMIAATLAPFEKSEYLTVTCAKSMDAATLSVDLPRYRLSFFRNSNDALESRNFPGMVIDHEDQSIGALYGLRSRLVLRPDDPSLAGARRKVLIPYGEIEIPNYLSDHVEVTIVTKDARLVRFADYVVDTDQGCLTGNASLKSRLYLVYLLAITSHCLPDPLTKHTGTEEALLELHTAACLSFRELGEEEMSLLLQIAKLTPTRFGAPQFSPRHQSITWNTLPSLSQHDGFTRRARHIIECAELQKVFTEDAKPPEKGEEKKDSLPKRNQTLDARAAARNAIYYPSDIASSGHHKVTDKKYTSRDTNLSHEIDAYSVAASVFAGGTSLLLPRTTPLPRLFSRWERIRAPSDTFKLSFNRSWFYVNMADSWLSIYTQCISTSKREKTQYQLLFSLSAMVFAKADYRCYVPSIVLASWDTTSLPQFSPPTIGGYSFDLQRGTEPTQSTITSLVSHTKVAFPDSPSWVIPINANESQEDYYNRRKGHYNGMISRYSTRLRDYFGGRWTGWMNGQTTLAIPPNVERSYFNADSLLDKIRECFRVCNENRLLLEHARQVNEIFELHFDDATTHDIEEYDFQPSAFPVAASYNPVTLHSLLQRDCPPLPERTPELWGDADRFRFTDAPAESDKLSAMLRVMDRSTLPLRKLYAQDLRESHRNLAALSSLPSSASIPYSVDELTAHMESCKERYQNVLQRMVDALAPRSAFEQAAAVAGTWPRLTLRSLLRRLAYPAHSQLTETWKEGLLLLARDVLEYQRAVRLLAYTQQTKKEDFFRELDTQSFDMANAMKHPDWALIQMEGNFMARPLQIKVAEEMIEPSSGKNTVLQLNMGEGKSSVIVPLVAAALANGEKVMRVVVLKPLAGQMFQLLVERLAGLANRRIFYMPFSRKIRVGAEQVAQIQKLYESCMAEGSVWIVQPEHILSFKLMGIDRSIASDTAEDRAVAESLSQLQRWLDQKSRDVLDESDEILHIRYQLIYTVGQQQPLELHPDRWIIIEELYTFVSRHIEGVKARNRNGIDLQPGVSGSFAPVRVIDAKAGRELIENVVSEIFNGRLSSFNVRFLPEAVQDLARQFITSPKVTDEVVVQLKGYCGTGNDWKHLLLLRGLIAHGILLYSLKERQYRVDYGLDLSRSLLAVPYRAKDVPSIRAEFGHPDVALTLTTLTYYYQGLTSAQLKLCFEILFKLDNPPLEYESWVDGDTDVPIHLQTLNGVNTDDADQHSNHIVPLFSKRKTVIDFYLSHVVFPKAAKEFPYKLSTSGWDLAESKSGHLTTGFSGTNDNRFLLPTSISQEDPLQQSGTNAKVLTYLLRRENDHYRCAALPNGGRLPVQQFIEYLTEETSEDPVQVLLDVGAQMLDLQNKDLAKYWLTLRKDMAAAIFFNDKDEMTVVTQDGAEEPLLSSPFKGQLEQCLVYLDDAHTRGTDLKLPANSRAAVTLGPKVTKDRLIQGCMRMRKLGFGQSVIFFAPDEIDRSIRKSRPAQSQHNGGTRAVPFSKPVHTEDILRWAIYETCRDIMRHLPHWAEQGWDYLRRRKAWDDFASECDITKTGQDEVMTPDIDILRKFWVRDEARTLEKMYGVITGPAANGVGGSDLNMREAIYAIPELRERLEMLGVRAIGENDVDEEQEREVNHEIEQETEIERPPKVERAKHHTSPGLEEFVSTGILPGNGQGEVFRRGFIPMYASLDGVVKRAPSNGQDVWSPGLLVTTDFATTISHKDVVERGNAEYLRPVTWILTSRRYKKNNVLVVISPYEANRLLPEIRDSDNVNLHVSSNHEVPPANIISQLNLFAGQLYLDSYEVYEKLCNFLGLQTGDLPIMDTTDDTEPYPVQSDGFIRPGAFRTRCGLEGCRFVESPVPFLQELIGLRRKGTGYLPTHLGKMVHGRLLTENDFA